MDITLGNLILAPRPRYVVEEVSYEPNLRDIVGDSVCAGCDGNGPVRNWDITYRIHFIGNGDLIAARRNYKVIERYLADLCSNNPKKLVRRYCLEDPLEYYIVSGYLKPINLDWLPGCCDNTTLSAEMHLISRDVETGAELMVYDYEVLKPNG